ncbi:hypothetical protein FOZ62_006303, partial [Perkinsus olseni]
LADLSALYDEVGAPVNAVEEGQQEEVEEAVGIEPESLHGIWGHNSDLLAVREALLGQCETRASDSTGIHVDPETHEEIELITVISNVNTGKTHDGVKEGGENLFR